MRLNYKCVGRCPTSAGSISPLCMNFSLPQSFSISNNGEMGRTADITINLACIVRSEDDSQAVLYGVNVSSSENELSTARP